MLAREAADSGIEIVVACGGDGTISQVANGLTNTRTRLGLLPLGTGNDLARHLGLLDPRLAVQAILTGSAIHADLVRWSSAGTHDRRAGFMLNVAGCGFDALVAERVNQGFKGLNGTSAYLAAVAATLATFQPGPLRVEVDGRVVEGPAMLCAVANASSYGGGMRIAPEARIDDGLLDVVLIGRVSRFEFLRTFPRVFKGTHVSHPAVTCLRGKKVLIEADAAMPILCDGELCGFTPAEFELDPGAIQILVPDRCA